MTKSQQQLSIRLNNEDVGLLEQTSSGKIQFTYHPDAKQIISLSMPHRNEPYGDLQTEAYFGGLLPESEMAKKIIGKRYGISPNNSFALLKAIGYDCAGAISCHAKEDDEISKDFSLRGRVVSDDELYTHIKALPQKPLFLDVEGLRLSLAGVQDKAAVCLIENNIALAENHCPTTHILKPSTPYFEGIAENEYFCLKIAKALGLPVPKIELHKIKDITFLLIERYDRRIKNNIVERIHQEDFCQALSILSTRKYQNEGGPGFIDCFNLLKSSAQPAIDRNELASIMVFNYLLGNMDAHGKNFSLLHHSKDNVRLAPFYDIVCTQVYEQLTKKMAMKIGGKYEADRVLPKHWEQLSEDIQYRYIGIKKLIRSQCERVLQIAKIERDKLREQDFNSSIIDKIIIVIENNMNKMLTQFFN